MLRPGHKLNQRLPKVAEAIRSCFDELSLALQQELAERLPEYKEFQKQAG